MTDRIPLRGLPEAERVALLAADGKGPDLLPLNLTEQERRAAMDPGLPAPVSPSTGFASSEGKLTAIAMLIGFILESVAIPLMERLKDVMPNAVWVPIVLAVLGVLLQIASLLGYQKSRTALKSAALLGAQKP